MIKRFIIGMMVAWCMALPYAAYASVPVLETAARQAILVDDTTGTVLFTKDADVSMPPSSMSKLMTAYMAFDHLKRGGASLQDTFRVNETAWRKQGSKMFVDLNSEIPLEALLQGIIVQSGNDACIVVAEGIAGSEDAFAAEMNVKAAQLGLANSHFVNATGWPDDAHYMTARDLATLTHHLIHDFPEYYGYFAETEYTYNGIRQYNRNVLLNRNEGVDGLKTGHTEAGGYGIVVSAKEGDRRLIAVVNGLSNEKERIQEADKLLRYGFRNFEVVSLFKAGDVVEQAGVWFGDKQTVPLVVTEDVRVTLPKAWQEGTTLTVRYQGPVPAPVEKGATVAELVLTNPHMKEETRIPLAAGEEVAPLGGVRHMVTAAKYYLFGS